jgi:glycolate oxidase FAD binding subunit
LETTSSLPESPQIAQTLRVTSSADVADVLRLLSGTGTPVIPVGGGTSLHTGNVTTDEYTAIDMRGMSGVREYNPTDLTASFWAGTTLADVRVTLEEYGQELPVDMVRPGRATIGGLVATGFAGPRRLGSATLKDLIIGCEYVRGDGLVAKAGGMLVKNVSGFEIPRFLHGSWGSLAVISAINVKVIPKPKADITFIHHDDALESSLAAQLRLLRGHPGVFAAVTERRHDGWVLAVRLLGRRASLDAQVVSMRDDLGADTDVVQGDEHWDDFNERWAVSDDLVRLVIGGRSEALRQLALELGPLAGVESLSLSFGTGTLRVALDPKGHHRPDVEVRLSRHPVQWVIESAPAYWRGTASVWGPEREDRPLVESIKAQFDPANILNRGRLFI